MSYSAWLCVRPVKFKWCLNLFFTSVFSVVFLIYLKQRILIYVLGMSQADLKDRGQSSNFLTDCYQLSWARSLFYITCHADFVQQETISYMPLSGFANSH